MELHQLRTFILVADEERWDRAAEVLDRNQATLEADIKSLESELGADLFETVAHGVELTPEGRIIYQKAQKVLQEADALLYEARALHGHVAGTFELGISLDPKQSRMETFFGEIASQHPSLDFRLLQRGSGDILCGLKTGVFDGGFVFGENPFPEQLAQLPLEEQKLVVVGSKHWHDELQRADWPELAAFPWIWESLDSPQRGLVEQVFADRGVHPTAVAYSGKGIPTDTLVMAGAGIGLMLEEEALKAEALGQVSIWHKMTFSLELFFAYCKNRGNDPFILAVLAGLKKVWKLE